MKQCLIHIILSVYLSVEIFAQLSPGQLTSAHASLEGLSNCTQCHTLGDKVTNAKCLACHQEIDDLLTAGRGYHASSQVRGQDCFHCHSEHHGRNFEMVRFDTERFDHALTGYRLTGAHAQADCRECHQPQFIRSPELRKKGDTWLGMETACTACHTDFHQGTLGNSCTDCHTTTSFAPATEFSHAETDFPLRGAHQRVDCASCHEVSTRNGSSFQEFSGVPFTNCSSCHSDPHQGRFGTNCKECHVEESFHLFRGMENFNHNQTGFPLQGKHRNVSCAECHNTKVSTDKMFKDFLAKDVSNCTACHVDVHENKFGQDCKSCHSVESFQSVRDFDAADHALTDFPLLGKHVTVDCRKCHEEDKTETLVFNQCASCHADFHEGQFVTPLQTPDCAQCHTVDGFAGSTFSIEDHASTAFPLTGAHLATPCFACHLHDEEWKFRDIGTACLACHEDVHAGSIDIRFYPDKACQSCHSTESWRMITFDHKATGWELRGKHASAECTACHVEEETAELKIVFTGLQTTCSECHDNIHGDQFVIDGRTDCGRCHDPAGWKPSVFDHQQSRFPLEGAHLNVRCEQCHQPEVVDGLEMIVYRNDRLACVDCHQ